MQEHSDGSLPKGCLLLHHMNTVSSFAPFNVNGVTSTLVNSMGSQAVMLTIAGNTELSSLQEASCFFSCQESSK